jgi:HSP20 family protein
VSGATTESIARESCSPSVIAYLSERVAQKGDRTMTKTLDETIEQVENLFQSVTGREAPPAAATPYAAIPPEKDPETHVGEQIERLLGSLAPFAGRPAPVATWTPAIWVGYSADKLLIHLDLPGVSREAVRVRLSNGALLVSGTRTPPAPGNQRLPYYAERPFGAFQRVIPLPGDVAADQVQAQLKDGVLSLQIPKVGPSAVEARDIVLS